jgi:ribosomal protein S18 acetylase RimI-like enzyme
MALSFRRGIAADFDALVILDSWGQRHQAIRDWLRDDAIVVAESGGRVVAFGVMRPIFFLEPFVELVMVDQAHRRRGIARALLAHFDTQHNRPKLWISTNRSNTPMQGLLASEGFTYAGEVEGLDEGDPELFYYRLRSS